MNLPIFIKNNKLIILYEEDSKDTMYKILTLKIE